MPGPISVILPRNAIPASIVGYNSIEPERVRCPFSMHLHFVVLQMKVCHGFDSFFKDVDRHVFVGRMNGVGLKAEAHEDGLNAKNFLESGDDGNTSSSSDGQWTLAEGSFKTSLGSLVGWHVDGTDIPFSAVEVLDVDFNGLGCHASEIVYHKLCDVGGAPSDKRVLHRLLRG